MTRYTPSPGAVLDGLGLQLPSLPRPRGEFIPYSRSGNLVFLSGQICEWNGEVMFQDQIGQLLTLEQGQEAAKICALNLLVCLSDAVDGNLDRVVACRSVRGFVNAAPGFPNVPAVINGASQLFVKLFGQRGRHARTAVGVSTLPMNASVEVDAIFEVDP